MSEILRSDELERVAGRFIDYVNAHTQPSHNGPAGALRDGNRSFVDSTQLIPTNSVRFGVFDPDAESGEHKRHPGYFIALLDEDTERYAVNFIYGQFYESDQDSGFGNLPMDPKIVDTFLDRLVRVETSLGFTEK